MPLLPPPPSLPSESSSSLRLYWRSLTAPKLWRTILVNFLSVNGFIISNHWNNFPKFLKEVAPKVADGTIAVKEDITEGLENAPQAFMDLLTGGNQGKAIVKVG